MVSLVPEEAGVDAEGRVLTRDLQLHGCVGSRVFEQLRAYVETVEQCGALDAGVTWRRGRLLERGEVEAQAAHCSQRQRQRLRQRGETALTSKSRRLRLSLQLRLLETGVVHLDAGRGPGLEPALQQSDKKPALLYLRIEQRGRAVDGVAIEQLCADLGPDAPGHRAHLQICRVRQIGESL